MLIRSPNRAVLFLAGAAGVGLAVTLGLGLSTESAGTLSAPGGPATALGCDLGLSPGRRPHRACWVWEQQQRGAQEPSVAAAPPLGTSRIPIVGPSWSSRTGATNR